jgi:hypothetical protein
VGGRQHRGDGGRDEDGARDMSTESLEVAPGRPCDAQTHNVRFFYSVTSNVIAVEEYCDWRKPAATLDGGGACPTLACACWDITTWFAVLYLTDVWRGAFAGAAVWVARVLGAVVFKAIEDTHSCRSNS